MKKENKRKRPPVSRNYGNNTGIAGIRYVEDVYEPTGSVCCSYIVTFIEYFKNGKKKKRHTKYVSVKQHGKVKAFEIAKQIKSEAEAKIREMFPEPQKKPRRRYHELSDKYVCKATGVTGAHLSIIRRPSGYTHRSYRATYIDPDTHKKVIKVFPVCKLGEKKARALAIKTRLDAVKQLKMQAGLKALRVISTNR